MRANAQVWAEGLLRQVRFQLSALKSLHLSPLAAIVLAALSAVSLGAALVAVYAIYGPLGSDSGVTVPDWKPPTLDVVELDPPKPASADVEALSRPIFAKNRKPSPKSAAPAAAAVLDSQTGLTVTAIVHNKKTTSAFLISTDTPDGAWRKVGDTVDAWTVTSITPAEVVLQSGGQLSKLQLYSDASSTAAPSPAPDPAAAPPPAGDAPVK